MVFFYGLFMDESLLASKGVRPTEPTIGYVDGYGLRIGKRATLLPEANSRAYGVLMKIASEDAAALYSEQSVADYVAEPVVVTLPGDILRTGRRSSISGPGSIDPPLSVLPT